MSDCPAFADVATAAERVVVDGVLPVDRDLISFEDVFAIHFARVEFGLRAAETHGRQLLDVVDDLEKALGAWEHLVAEISPQPVADDGNAMILGNVEQLGYLLFRQELGFVDQYDGGFLAREDGLFQIKRGIGDDIDCPFVPAAGDDLVLPFGVDAGFDHDDLQPALLVVISSLDESV